MRYRRMVSYTFTIPILIQNYQDEDAHITCKTDELNFFIFLQKYPRGYLHVRIHNL